MKLKIIKTVTILISFIIFIISLNNNAVTIDYQGIKTIPSVEYFLIGSIAFLGGGILEEVVWLANPLSLIAIILFLMDNVNSLKFSITALILAVSFSSWNSLLGAESGTQAKILSLEFGYYLWILSMLILTIGTYYYFKIENEEIENFI